MDKLRFVAITAVLITLGCAAQKAPSGTGLKAVWTDSTKAIFAKATKVEVFRLDGKNSVLDAEVTTAGDHRIGGFLVISQGGDQGREFADRLATLLSNEQLYTNHFVKCFWPGVAFRIWNDHECVEILVCFYCGNFYCGPPTTMQRMENASFRDSPLRPQLVQLAKQAFPEDKEIQALEN